MVTIADSKHSNFYKIIAKPEGFLRGVLKPNSTVVKSISVLTLLAPEIVSRIKISFRGSLIDTIR